MKKLFLISILFFSIKSFSQNAYYDALTISKYISNGTLVTDSASKAEYCKILNNYLIHPHSVFNANTISNDYCDSASPNFNPFLSKFFPVGGLSAASGIPLKKSAEGLLSSIGGLDITNIADGFAKFIVERTKKELQAAFFDRFIKELKKPEYEDAQKLFPSTYAVILRLPQDVYNYEKYLQSLRDAFGKDMEAILPHLEDVLKNGRYKEFFNQHLELKSICLTALYFGNGLQKGTHIGELIEKYNAASPDYKLTTANTDTVKTNAIRFIQEISKSFRTRSSEAKEYWVQADSILMMVNDQDPTTFNIYLGLFYARVNTIRVCNTDPVTYGAVMAKIDDNINKLKNLIETVSGEIGNVQSQIQGFQEKAKKDRTVDDYIGYFNSATRMIESFKENDFVRNITSLLPASSQTDINFYWDKYSNVIEATNTVLSIYTSVKEKNYSVAMSSAGALYEMRFQPKQASRDSITKNVEKVIAFLLDKGAFIASVAQAKTSKEVYDAINAAAMPTGSARVKRLSITNIAVNAYCGFFVGNEVIKEVDPDKPFARFNSYGITAPIGFSFSKGDRILPWPFSQLFKVKGFSSTWFVSLVDLGAIAAYRFTNDSTEQVPTIQLKDIFSPGLFWSVGLPKLPLSLNLGAQIGPNLRKVTNSVNDYSNKTYIRYSFSVCVDLPLLNLYTKSK